MIESKWSCLPRSAARLVLNASAATLAIAATAFARMIGDVRAIESLLRVHTRAPFEFIRVLRDGELLHAVQITAYRAVMLTASFDRHVGIGDMAQISAGPGDCFTLEKILPPHA